MKTSGLLSKKNLIIAAILVVCVIVTVFVSSNVSYYNRKMSVSTENARAMEYVQVEENDAKTNSDYVSFDAFFLRDLDEDGYAESIRGTCKEVGTDDTLYMELKVSGNGYLENAVIRMINGNYYFNTVIPKDSYVKDNEIGSNIRAIEFNNLYAGTQKLLTGKVRSGNYNYKSSKLSAIGDDTNNYSKVNSIVLTGTHVADDGTRTEIEKVVEFNLDWYGTAKAEVYDGHYNGPNYKNQTYYFDEMVNPDSQEVVVSFDVAIAETQNKLLLNKTKFEVDIPKLNGYDPLSVEVTTKGITSQYDETTGVLSGDVECVLDENGVITNNAYDFSYDSARYKVFNVVVKYDKEAYETLGTENISLKVPVRGQVICFNNTNPEFTNPYESNIATKTINVLYTKKVEYVYEPRYSVSIGKYVYNPYLRSFVSKEKPLNFYNNIDDVSLDDNYIVRWDAYTGSELTQASLVLKEARNDEARKVDTIIKNDESTISTESFISHKGIYFDNAENVLGENGWIKVYDDETNDLLATFDSVTWDKFTESNPYLYELPVKNIRVETSENVSVGYLYIYHVKNIDNEYLTETYTKEEFDTFAKIETNLVVYRNGLFASEAKSSAKYENPISYFEVYLNNDSISTQGTEKNFRISIYPRVNKNYNLAEWHQGTFLIKLPPEIVDVEIDSVIAANDAAEISSYEIIEQEGTKFIKVITKAIDAKNFNYLYINLNITPNPKGGSVDRTIEVYGYNSFCKNYKEPVEDIYDINGNLNVSENVGIGRRNVSIVAPNTLLTSQTLMNFDDLGSETVAPELALITKARRTATVELGLRNNYSSSVSEVVVLGKIPFAGNTYALNEQGLNSTYSVYMENTGIVVPEELVGIVDVYYSENEKPNKDLNDIANGWTKNPNDFSKVKTFLLVFNDYVLARDAEHYFTYNISIPVGIKYNEITYSHHGIYFSLDTEEGKYRTNIEPNKLGIMVARKFDLTINKFQEDTNKLIPGATYKVTEQGTEDSRTGTTDANGNIVIKDLFAEKTYVIKEILSPDQYSLNSNEVVFTTVENEQGELEVNLVSGEVRDNITIAANEEGKAVVTVNVEDDVRPNINLIVSDLDTDQRIRGARYKITGKGLPEGGRLLKTNENGEVSFVGLYLNEEYTLDELASEGYYLDEQVKFKIVNTNGVYSVETVAGRIKEVTVVTNDEIPTMNINVQNEPIPRYTLNLNTIVKDQNVVLPGVEFKLVKGSKIVGRYKADENGMITIPDLFAYEAHRDLDQTYMLREISAPAGYAKLRDIKFRIVFDETNNVYTPVIEDGSVKETSVNGSTVTFVIENSPTFKLIKTDSSTGARLPGVKFEIYDVQTGLIARNGHGEIVGTLEDINGEMRYVVTTDENGQVVLDLPEGLYKAIEVYAPERFEFGDEEIRTHYFGIGMSKDETDATIVEVDKIESIPNSDYINGVEEIPTGGYYAVGTMYSPSILLENGQTLTKHPDLGPLSYGADYSYEDFPNISIGENIEDSSDAFIIKYNEDGSIAWASNEGSGYHEEYFDVAVTPDGGCVAVGIFYGNEMTFSNGQYIYNEYDYPMGILVKYSSTGEIEYVHEYSEYEIVLLDKVIVTTDGEYIVTARSWAMEDKSEYDMVSSNYWDQGIPVLLRADKVGQLEEIDSLFYERNCYKDLEKTPDGGWVVAGTFEYDFPFNNGDIAITNGTYYNGFFAKYDALGNAEWTKVIHDADINSIDQMTDGGYIVGGHMYGFLELENGSVLISNNYCDGLVLRYNKDIELVNAKNIMRAQYTTVNNVVATENNSYLICADTYVYDNSPCSMPLSANYPNFSIGFIEKYDKNENLIWDEYIYDVNGDEDEILWAVTLFDAVKLNKCGDYIAAGNYFAGRNNDAFSLSTSYLADSGPNVRYQAYNGTLIRIRPNAIPEREVLEVGNNLKTYKIYTSVKQVYSGRGGDIAGEDYRNMTITQPYEIVKHGENNIKPIYCYPYEGYEIGEITINGIPQEFTPNEDGTYILPQITNITEDMHIEVEFVVSTNKFTINKVDELTGDPLKDAEFKIEQIEERPAVNTEDVASELTDNSKMFYATDESVLINDTIGTLESWTQTSTVIDESNDISEEVLGDIVANGNTGNQADTVDIASEVIGELTESNTNQTVVNYENEITGVVGEPEAVFTGGYYFVKENGVYVPTNSATYQIANGGTEGIHGSEAISYFPIDLTNYEGKYKVVVNVTSSTEEEYDYGMIGFSDTNIVTDINMAYEETMEFTGEIDATDYISFTLEGGKINYMFVGYIKDESEDVGEDRITVNSIKVYEAEEVTYNFVENEDGEFESTNEGVPATISSSYVTLDLTGKDGSDYYVYIDSYIYSDYMDRGYVIITETPDMPKGIYNYESSKRFLVNGNAGDTTKTLTVAGGKKYYIHFGYAKDGAFDRADDKFIIKDIGVNKIISVTYQFVENENGGYESNNHGKSYVTASSYIPIDLTNHTGTYVVNLNGYVTESYEYNYGYAYATINQGTSRPNYSTSTGRFVYTNGSLESGLNANDYTYTLEGGSLYYLHLGYYTGYNVKANEKFVVNSIKVYGTKTQAYGFEQTADGKYVPTNIGVENSEAVARIPIDLTGYTGNYRVVVNAEVSSQSGYDIAFANIGTSSSFSTLKSYYGTRIMKVSGEKGATNYEYLMTGGSKYYLCFGYKKDGSISSGSDKVTINSINVYGTKEAYFNFKQNDDGSIESTNQGHNSTTANSYRIIDLTNYTGKYNLNMTYSISSQSTDYGYIALTATETAPGAYDSGCLIRKSGTYSNETYTHVLQGGSVYYLHFGYVKDSTTHEGDDKFTIHDISVTLNSSDLYYDYVRTNTSGKAITQLPFGKYQITEVVAPEGYNLLETPVIVEYRTVEDGEVTITNGQDGRVIVHHYLENTTESVYEDEIIKAPVGTEYSTMPKEATAEYDLIKDENGEYILPDNMTGTIINGVIEVTYYYDNISVPLRVNHLILGTNRKVLLQDGTEKETINSIGIEGDTYTTSQLTPEELNEKYEIAEVPANAEGVFEYDDVVVNYYYKVKTFDVTTDVNGEGGTISGQDMESYENIEYGEDSTKEIVIEPEEDYYVEEVTVNNQPMMFSVRPNRSVVLNSFSGVTEDKNVIATFALTQGNVIVHHYKAIENEDGTLTYTEEKLTEDEVKTGDIGAMFATKESDLVPVYYEVCDSSEVTSGTYTEEDIEVTYYYKYKDFDYTVEY